MVALGWTKARVLADPIYTMLLLLVVDVSPAEVPLMVIVSAVL